MTPKQTETLRYNTLGCDNVTLPKSCGNSCIYVVVTKFFGGRKIQRTLEVGKKGKLYE